MAVVEFVLAAILSLAASVVLVARLERVGERLGMPEALLGLMIALAADGPEIASALTATATGQPTVGVGVVLGSNVFNLAALLGLGAVVAGGLRLPRRTVALEGGLALLIALTTVAVLVRVISPIVGLDIALAAFVPYVVFCALRPETRARLLLPRRFLVALRRAVEAEEQDASRALPGDRADAAMAAVATATVIGASVVMEQAGTTAAAAAGVSQLVIGGLVLAAITSLPNAVAAIYLATRARGVAAMSEAFHSNTFNVLAGFLAPAVLVALGPIRPDVPPAGVAYLGMTVLTVALAWTNRGLRRRSGILIIAAYLTYAGYLVSS